MGCVGTKLPTRKSETEPFEQDGKPSSHSKKSRASIGSQKENDKGLSIICKTR